MIALASANLPSRHSTARCSALAMLDAGESPTGGVCRPAVGFWSAYLKFVGGLLCVDNTRAGTERGLRRAVSSLRQSVGIDDFDPAAGPVRLAEPRGDLPAGGFDGLTEGSAEGEVGRGRGGQGATCAMKSLRDPPPPQALDPSPVVEDVDEGPLHVTALDEDGFRSESVDGPRRALHRFDVRDPEARQALRLEAIRGDEGGATEEAVHEGVREVVLLEARPDRRHHDRVHDEGERRAAELARDDPHDLGRVEHARLSRAHIEVPEDRAELLPDFGRGNREDRVDGARGLGHRAWA